MWVGESPAEYLRAWSEVDDRYLSAWIAAHLIVLAESVHKHGGATIPLSMVDRIRTSAAFGYMNAKHMVYMKETLGFPLEMYVMEFRRRLGSPLRVDYGGLRHELLMIGQNPRTVETILDELKLEDKDHPL